MDIQFPLKSAPQPPSFGRLSNCGSKNIRESQEGTFTVRTLVHLSGLSKKASKTTSQEIELVPLFVLNSIYFLSDGAGVAKTEQTGLRKQLFILFLPTNCEDL